MIIYILVDHIYILVHLKLSLHLTQFFGKVIFAHNRVIWQLMASVKKRKNNPTADDRPFKRQKQTQRQRQLTLYSFYNKVPRESLITRKVLNYNKKKKKTNKEQTLHHYYIYDIAANNIWYVQRGVKHVICALQRMYINNNIRIKDSPTYVKKATPGLQSLTEYIAKEKLMTKIRRSQEILYFRPIISTRSHSSTSHCAGTEQKESINKLVFGFIRTQFEDILDLEIPQDLKNAIPAWYGNIIMTSNIVNMNHIQIIGYTLNAMIPKLNHFKLHQTLRFQDNGHDIRFIVIIKTNTQDILMYYHAYEEDDWSLFLQTSVETRPVKYRWNRIYHLPNNYVFDSTLNFSEIFIEWVDRVDFTDKLQPISGIGSLLSHNLMKPEHTAIECTQFEVFLFE